jgi:ATP-binding cassette subfamily B protein
LSLHFHTKARSGDLVARVISDVGQLRDVVVTAALPLCANILILFGMLGVMLYVNWQLALLALVTAPLFVLSTIRLGKRIKEVARAQRKREGMIAATASESIHAIKVVQALSLEDTFNQAFRNYNQKSLKDGVKGTRLAAKLERTVDVFIALSTALVLWYGTQLVLRGELSTGWLVVFLSYLKNAFKPTRDLAKYAGRLAKASASGERIIDLLQQEPDIRDLPEAVDAPRFRGAVRFENVSFSYEPSQLVLQNVELAVEPAQLVAIVGPSGNGKSTLVSLLLRLYDPQQGGVLIDGRDIRSFTLASLRAQISVVLQENVLFAASVRDNIAYGAPEASDAEIERAARLANAHDFILALPEGYNTVLSERGASLSGGQRQRIAIARAAVRNAPLLVLDELTTGLDEENEQIVVEAIERLARGRTTFAITHNLDMATRADLVVYLEDRQIVERETHAELMARDGRYAGLYRLQTAAHAFAAYHEEGHALAS